MGFPASIYNEALEQKRKIRQKNEALREQNKQELYKIHPKAQQLDQELSKIGMNIALAAFSGDQKRLKALEEKSEKLQKERDALTFDGYFVPYVCKECLDTGIKDGKMCSCVKDIMKNIQYKKLSTFAPVNECTLNNFNLDFYPTAGSGKIPPKTRMEANFKYIQKYIKNFPNGENLLMVGGTGLGKTHLSVALAGAILDKGFSVLYSSSEYLVNKLVYEKFQKNGVGEYYEAISECDLLVLDDLGTELPTQMVSNSIYEIINTRILLKKSTIINTNLTMSEVEAKYGAAVSSRLIGEYKTILFDGEDIRQLKNK